MAKQKSKASNSKPIVQHQLFPAVVALWFGALFGLGSIAVRPSLIEQLVVAAKIDLVIPAATPPLGLTARILLALVMAALGASIGTVIARRLGQVKPAKTERKRTKLSTRDEGGDRYVAPTIYAPAEDLQDEQAAGSGAMPASRRRSLTVESEPSVFVPAEAAPVPGGAPQIFDIAAMQLESPQATPASAPIQASLNDAVATSGGEAQAVQPASAPQLAASAAAQPLCPAEPAVPVHPAPPALDWANAAPIIPDRAGSPMATPAAMIVPTFADVADDATVEAPFAVTAANLPDALPGQAITLASAAPDLDDRQVFGMAAPAIPAEEQPRQIFGTPIVDGHVGKEFVEQHGFQTSVFQTQPADPLFERRDSAAATIPHPPAAAELPRLAPESPLFVAPSAPLDVAATTPPEPAVEPQAPLPSPATLGIEDLALRLTESMRRRRAARSGQTAPAPVADAAIAAQEPSIEPETLAPAALGAIAAEPVTAAPQPVGAIESASASDAVDLAAMFAPPAPTVEAEPIVASAQIPASMRPLDLEGFEEHDDDHILPPRHIAMPVAPPVPTPYAPVAATSAPEEPDSEQRAVAEESYASLLGVTPSPAVLRNPFVRVEEFEGELAAVEPVVIFPGHAAAGNTPFQPAQGASAPIPFRQFDAPNNAGSGQPVAAHANASAMPSAEAEQALRSALANLQRISAVG